MSRSWYIIDDAGWRRIDVKGRKKGEKRWDFWSGFRDQADKSAPWPAFMQIAVCAAPERVSEAIVASAQALGIGCRRVTGSPHVWDEAILVGEDPSARQQPMTLISQPIDAPEMALFGLDTVDEFFYQLGADGAFYAHDPDTGTLVLSAFRGGEPRFSWQDSLQPGRGWALSFHEDGRASVEDPRPFALRRMGLPESSPFLDRYAFVEHEVRQFGVEQISALLANRPIVAAFSLDEVDADQLELNL